jgi:bla regulator protein blaR1
MTLNRWYRDATASGSSRSSLYLLAGIFAMAGPVLVGVWTPQLNAQSPVPRPDSSAAPSSLTFEVASVKPNKSGEPFVRLGIQPGGRYTATNVPLRLLIRNAYQIQDFQLIGAPDWVSSDRFDIVAKAEGDVPPSPPGGPPGPIQFMLRALLAERFNLKVHSEQRELPIYALVVARNDGKLGAQLRPAAVDCAAVMAGRRGGPPPAPPQPGERMPCGMRIGPGQLTGGSLPVSQIANTLSPFVGRVVVDRTGLSGNFDFDLTWTPDQIPQGPPPPGAPQLPPIDPNGPSILTAVQEQLGLKLDSTKGPVDVLVVDRVARPTPD